MRGKGSQTKEGIADWANKGYTRRGCLVTLRVNNKNSRTAHVPFSWWSHALRRFSRAPRPTWPECIPALHNWWIHLAGRRLLACSFADKLVLFRRSFNLPADVPDVETKRIGNSIGMFDCWSIYARLIENTGVKIDIQPFLSRTLSVNGRYQIVKMSCEINTNMITLLFSCISCTYRSYINLSCYILLYLTENITTRKKKQFQFE